jgi:hypothetical protein
MTREHRTNVAKALNYLINDRDYSVIGTDKKGSIKLEDYYISVNHEQRQIILGNKEDCWNEPAMLQFRKLIGE